MEILKIVKIGGNIIDNENSLDDFLSSFARLKGPKLLVHGGGKLATEFAKKMGVKVKMTNGRRITDADTLDIITMVYAGKINKNIVAKLQSFNCNSVGFSGADGNSIVSVKRPIKEVDFGFVGDVVKVNTEAIQVLLKNKITPVYCAISHDENGQLLNTNADTIASELAVGFANHFKTELYYCFEKNGVLRDLNDDDSVIESINTICYQKLINEGIIAEGMLPKMKNCFHAIDGNVSKVCIGKPEMLFKSDSKFTTFEK